MPGKSRSSRQPESTSTPRESGRASAQDFGSNSDNVAQMGDTPSKASEGVTGRLNNLQAASDGTRVTYRLHEDVDSDMYFWSAVIDGGRVTCFLPEHDVSVSGREVTFTVDLSYDHVSAMDRSATFRRGR